MVKKVEDLKKKEGDRIGKTEKMLSAILERQQGMSNNIKTLIMTVADVQKDAETLKPLVAKVDNLTKSTTIWRNA